MQEQYQAKYRAKRRQSMIDDEFIGVTGRVTVEFRPGFEIVPNECGRASRLSERYGPIDAPHLMPAGASDAYGSLTLYGSAR